MRLLIRTWYFVVPIPDWRQLAACLLLGLTAGAGAAELTGYDIAASVEPGRKLLVVDAVVDLPPGQAGRTVEFLLTSGLAITASTPKVEKLKDAGAEGFQGINGSSVDLARQDGITRYRVTLPEESSRLTLNYRGRIDFALETQAEEYARGFRETPGVIGEEGVYLAGSTLWYPYFSNELVSFKLNVRVPDGWHLISQGDGTSRGDDGVAKWDSAGPVDEIYLVGGPLTRYDAPAGSALAEVYLRAPDDALADKYLDATARYIEMYRGLIGPYPYGKFALVENFWETGYGMPSFTLLGSQIIRFPFILTSSYPHEILHNWWGNSVFVDYESGNWCEGLTAYMADHLIKEQQGLGAQYRRDTLKKYRDFVKEDRDFPLTEFRSRHSAATEAIGYGKTLMGFHTLRRRAGDDLFRQALANFYRQQRGNKASFSDVRNAFEAATGADLERFFHEWVGLPGAADLALEDIQVTPGGKGFLISGRLLQRQAQGPFELEVPVAITTTNGTAVDLIRTGAERTEFQFSTRNPPLQLSLDPEFDVFRLLDARETAPSIGQVFGEPAVLAVLPAAAEQAERDAWRGMIGAWKSPVQSVEFMRDDEVDRLPADRAIWLLGRDNRIAARVFRGDRVASVDIRADGVGLPNGDVGYAGNSTVIIARHPGNVEKAVGWITVDPAAAFDGMARKLPHYGKYSYLAFRGDEPENFLKGEWNATDSPLLVDLRGAGRASAPIPTAKLPARKPLADLPPVFSRDRLLAHVNWLAAPEREGRGMGSAGLEASAEYIAARFAEIGLEPAGDDGSFFQTFTVNTGPEGGPHDIRNVIGFLPGSNPAFTDQAALITAHYDHLGYGWPDERAQAEPGAIYHGADDNASGVAVLIELARAYAEQAPPPRSLVFVAFSGEEAGLLGSAYYVEHPSPAPLDGIIGVINMDTVGRLGDQPVTVLATESATEWPHVFRGVGFTTGIPTKSVPGAAASSDQHSFIKAGVPGVQIFTSAHLDYHRPSDTADKVDGDGMVAVATVVKEAATYLAERPEPLTVAGEAANTGAADQAPASAGGNRRRVSFGTVPDFAFQGPGVRVESVIPGSPAARAGIQDGDVITALNGEAVADLGAFSEALKQFEPGDRVTASGLREGAAMEVEMELSAR